MEKKYQVVLLILFFILLTFISFLFSPFFDVRDFIFHSRTEFNRSELRSSINKFYGKNLLFLNKDELKNSLLKHDLISSVQVEKSFPSTIHVVIEERKAVAWLKNNDQKLIFSADGIILGEVDLNEELAVPQFENFPYYFNNNKLELPHFTDDIIKVLNNLDFNFLAKIKKVNYQDDIYKLYLKQGGGVNLGSNNELEEKFAILNSILKNNQDNEIDYINLQVTKHPVIKLK
ncbi:cell division protein FtsQ/DivIB [Halanaerobium sp.]|uniref:cell division protein FtsQ/DivIB n=1 Tax=Halanaerobium sp. TaxID=1895664 RepID=UPI000DE719D7|nr:FtsQ-type POTRA domain-containing protein [Halanaerobium sp.]PUU87883.1 MAG: Cell division protein FtsQ [Halanaerobium sp.]